MEKTTKFEEIDESVLDFFDSEGNLLEFDDLKPEDFSQISKKQPSELEKAFVSFFERAEKRGQKRPHSGDLVISYKKRANKEMVADDDKIPFGDIRNAVNQASKNFYSVTFKLKSTKMLYIDILIKKCICYIIIILNILIKISKLIFQLQESCWPKEHTQDSSML